MIHQINIITHVVAGTLALLLGLILIMARKGTSFHRRFGRLFIFLLIIVTGSGFFGWLFFRSNPLLLMLTLLASYNTFAGFRIVRNKEKHASWIDVAVAITALGTGLFYLFFLMYTDANWSPTVVYSTLSGLFLVTTYDLLKFFFFHEKIKSWWLHEHIYKIVSAFGALLAAFVGTVLPDYKPYSQVGPTGIVLIIIVVSMMKVRRLRLRV